MRLTGWVTTVAVSLGAGLLIETSVRAQASGSTNDLLPLLESSQATFGSFAGNRGLDGGAESATIAGLDFILYDMEHNPIDFGQFRIFLQGTLNPAAILQRGRPGTSRPVIVRIPAYGREMNQWMAKQALDSGAHGVMFPHIETVEQALSAIRSMRFAQAAGAPDFEPNGQRGSGTGWPARVWGLTAEEYRAKADLWRLDPNGELVSVIQIENELGVRNVRDIARQVKGIGVIFPGPGDLGVWYGGDQQATESAIQTVLAACKEFDIPCGITANASDVGQRVKEGFRFVVTSGQAVSIGRTAAGRTR